MSDAAPLNSVSARVRAADAHHAAEQARSLDEIARSGAAAAQSAALMLDAASDCVTTEQLRDVAGAAATGGHADALHQALTLLRARCNGRAARCGAPPFARAMLGPVRVHWLADASRAKRPPLLEAAAVGVSRDCTRALLDAGVCDGSAAAGDARTLAGRAQARHAPPAGPAHGVHHPRGAPPARRSAVLIPPTVHEGGSALQQALVEHALRIPLLVAAVPRDTLHRVAEGAAMHAAHKCPGVGPAFVRLALWRARGARARDSSRVRPRPARRGARGRHGRNRRRRRHGWHC